MQTRAHKYVEESFQPCVRIPIYNKKIENDQYEGYIPTVKDEWQIIELQGNLSSRPEKNKPLDSVVLGQLTTKTPAMPNQPIKCDLLVGRQKCEGKQLAIKKPLLVLERVTSHNESAGEGVKYRVVGVVREKVHFATRPMPLSPSEKNQMSKISGTGEAQSVVADPSVEKAKLKRQQDIQRTARNLNVHPMFLPREKKNKKSSTTPQM